MRAKSDLIWLGVALVSLGLPCGSAAAQTITPQPHAPDCAEPIALSPAPCIQKVDQRGGNSYPPLNQGWALEIALDVEIAHAICQNCSIMLVEADSSGYADMMAAVDFA